jgi:predicted ATPase
VPKAGWHTLGNWLAAGQVAALGLKNTVARLELMKLANRSAVARHQTLKATLDCSYNLLSDGERIVLRRIAPFVGHFTLEGAGPAALL